MSTATGAESNDSLSPFEGRVGNAGARQQSTQ
jgi:hypothetical protein